MTPLELTVTISRAGTIIQKLTFSAERGNMEWWDPDGGIVDVEEKKLLGYTVYCHYTEV
jgi:hypothetical protein